MVRRLERLSREQQTPQLRNLARQAQAAAEAMRRATSSDGNGVADARAALDRLRNIQRQASNQPRQRLQRGIGQASRRAEELAREHDAVGSAAQALPEEKDARGNGVARLQSRKLRMAEAVRSLESDLRKLARDAKQAQSESERALRAAADGIAAENLADTIERSAAALGESKDAAEQESGALDAEVGESLARLGENLGEAAAAADGSAQQARAQSLEQMRALVEGLESLERRMLQRSRGGQSPGGESRAGEARGGWGAADGQSRMDRNFDPADIDNFRRDFAQRRGLLERFGQVLTSEEHGARDIGRLLEEMRALENADAYRDPQRALQRQRTLIAELKALEFRLRQDPEQAVENSMPASGDDTVAPAYQPLVDEYYRELSRARHD